MIYKEKFKAMGNSGDGSDSQVSTNLFVEDARDKEIQLKASAIKRTQDITNIGMGAALGFCIALFEIFRHFIHNSPFCI